MFDDCFILYMLRIFGGAYISKYAKTIFLNKKEMISRPKLRDVNTIDAKPCEYFMLTVVQKEKNTEKPGIY